MRPALPACPVAAPDAPRQLHARLARNGPDNTDHLCHGDVRAVVLLLSLYPFLFVTGCFITPENHGSHVMQGLMAWLLPAAERRLSRHPVGVRKQPRHAETQGHEPPVPVPGDCRRHRRGSALRLQRRTQNRNAAEQARIGLPQTLEAKQERSL